ncbi:5,10-methylenetetrahydrofolate reductase [Arthrobacter crystallopoietes BAB-32]|uniref:Methylenetetrahydrofolate reductase n=1 Tax=Arthrobacter crystallopoietes BAB-32 TaxID=1246476 RepID=N1UX45_9MICC|nr:methylenetetrahydrofolate reductase [Arthrobacter crystallopoietes]EMY32402.1 5,10-methylenetetrahydrofolate reductase [Arthrobacter crystallopoietes BAB-32]
MTRTAETAVPPSLSYELYPPAKPSAEDALLRAIDELGATQPDYVSVTYSGTPSRRRASIELIEHLVGATRLRPLAHLTCVGETRASLRQLVRQFVGLGVRGVLAMRGDLPAGPEVSRGELPFARYLVELIREVEESHSATLAGGRIAVGVAAYPNPHPESPSFQHDVEVLVSKERSGADFAISQVYFDPADYVRLVTAARGAGVTIPIIPGVIPMSSVRRLERLAVMTGVRPDARLLHRLETASSDAERRRIGVAAAADLARAAFDAGAPGLHLYTFNDAPASVEVVEALDLPAIRTLSTAVSA